MAIKLGELFYQFTSKGFEKTQAQVGTADQKAKKAGVTLGSMKTALMALGGTAVLYSLKKLIDSFTNYTEQIDKANKITGISTKTLQELKYAAEQEHASFEQLQKGMTMLVRSMQDVQDGSIEGVRAFDRIGVSALNADGSLRDVGDVFMEVADKIANTESETDAMSMALELLGRSGAEMVPFMKLGKDSINELRTEAHQLGLVLDDASIKAGKRLADSMTAMKGAVKGLSLEFVDTLLPAIKWTTDALVSFVKGMRELFGGETRLKAKQIEDQNKLIASSLEKYQKWLREGVFTQEQYGIAVKKLMKINNQWNTEIAETGENLKTQAREQEGVIEITEEMREAYQLMLELNAAVEERQRLYNDQLARERELKGDILALDPTLEQNKATGNKSTKDQVEVTGMMTEAVGSELIGAFQGLSDMLFSNSMSWFDWGQSVVKSLIGVGIQMLALAGIIKLLEALGVPAGALLAIGQKAGLYQTPSGDAFAYREGRDFGRFFFEGFGERFDSFAGKLSGRTNQVAPVVIVTTGDPATFVNFASKMPQQYKSKFYRKVTRPGERLEE